MRAVPLDSEPQFFFSLILLRTLSADRTVVVRHRLSRGRMATTFLRDAPASFAYVRIVAEHTRARLSGSIWCFSESAEPRRMLIRRRSGYSMEEVVVPLASGQGDIEGEDTLRCAGVVDDLEVLEITRLAGLLEMARRNCRRHAEADGVRRTCVQMRANSLRWTAAESV